MSERFALRGGSARGRRILLTTFGSLGDLYPYVAIARELKARGHEPVIGASAFYRELVERFGIGFRAIRPDLPDPEKLPDLMVSLMDPKRGTEFVIRRIVLPALRESYEDTLAASKDVDLLISHLLTFTTPLIASQRGLPWASTVLQPLLFLSAHEPAVAAQAPWLTSRPLLGPLFSRIARAGFSRLSDGWFTPLRELRADLGMPPATDNPFFNSFSPWLTLALFSRVFASPRPDWPAPTVVTGFPFMDPPGGALPPDLAEFLDRGEPPIVFTLGSSAVMTPGDFFNESIRAASKLGQRAVLLTGLGAETLRRTLPRDVFAIDYAPHAAIFPRASAIVHQGGVGTTAEGMRSGKPTLVMPFAHDQFDNAHRVERLGISRTIMRGRYTASNAARELQRLFDLPYRWRADEVGQRVRREDGVGAACDAIEALLESGRGLTIAS